MRSTSITRPAGTRLHCETACGVMPPIARAIPAFPLAIFLAEDNAACAEVISSMPIRSAFHVEGMKAYLSRSRKRFFRCVERRPFV